MLTTFNQVFFIFIDGGISSEPWSLQALYLSGTFCHGTSIDPLAVQMPRQPAIYFILEDHLVKAHQVLVVPGSVAGNFMPNCCYGALEKSCKIKRCQTSSVQSAVVYFDQRVLRTPNSSQNLLFCV